MTMLTTAPQNDPATAAAQPSTAAQPTTQTAGTTAPTQGTAVPAQQQQQATAKQSPDAAGSGAQDQAKTTDDGSAPQGAPERYDFKAPQGAEVDAQVLTAFSEVARDLNLSQEAAQKVLDKVTPVMAERRAEALKAQLDQARNTWVSASKADKEFGGSGLNENLSTAKKALDAFGSTELRAFLEDSGLGDHPEMIRLLYRAGRAISSDRYVGGREPASKPAPRTFEEHLANLYPSN